MKLCQFYVPGHGRRIGVVDGEDVVDITAPRSGAGSALELIAGATSAVALERRVAVLARRGRSRIPWRQLDRTPSRGRPHLLAPLEPPEVWGAGITYRRSREYYTAHTVPAPEVAELTAGRAQGIYDHVYESARPELFFKATAARTVGPNARVGLRAESRLTAVEAELAVVLGARGTILGYTIGNDLSAWDIERENPLFLPQSKIFDGCFALGPVIATARSVRDPHALAIGCRILRGGALRWEGRASTAGLKRRVDELVGWLVRGNAVPAGTVLSTGTGILVPDEHALEDGDAIEITLEGVGTLRNVARRLR